MSGLRVTSGGTINFRDITVLVIADQQVNLEVYGAMFQGFGVKGQVKCTDLETARQAFTANKIDLVVIQAAGSGWVAADFIRWVRRENTAPDIYTPCVVISAFVTDTVFRQNRDVGASYIISKPLTPQVMMDRLVHLARDERPYVETTVYFGPDRRTRFLGPPDGGDGRRSTDAVGELGDSQMPNMSQDEIDALLRPQKAFRS